MAQVIPVLTAAVLTASGQSATVGLQLSETIAQQAEITIEVEASAVSGTSPSAQFVVVWSEDGTHWAADGDNVGAAMTAAGNQLATFPVRGPFLALSYVLTGTTPSFTVTAQAFA